MSHKVQRPDFAGRGPKERLNEARIDDIFDALEKFTIDPDENGCIRWAGAISPAGYGQMYVSRWLRTSAHRAAWVAMNGPLDPALDACHSCDNRWCVNHEHIFPGTRAENMLDAGAKGKLKGRPVGTRPQRKAACPSTSAGGGTQWKRRRRCASGSISRASTPMQTA